MIYNLSFIINFSILAPHEGERHDMQGNIGQLGKFSILAPHEGERLLRLSLCARI